jgi:phosphotransferase system HPr-like phosphotransfer protein
MFGNLKTQCYYKLRDLAEKRAIKIDLEGKDKDDLVQDLENVLNKNLDKD